MLFSPKRFEEASFGVRGTFWLQLACIGLAVAALFITSPTNGDFWWFDAPSHAMNGVFVHDLLISMPIRDPVGYAEQYFADYPALSILFYPPLFYAAEAILYFLIGVHHSTAQLTVALFTFGFATGVFQLARGQLGPWSATAAALLALSMPGIALWSRQVMLELPAYAFLVWFVYFLMRYVERGDHRSIFAAAFLLACALYTKQTVAFMAVAATLAVLALQGWRIFFRREVWLSAALGIALLIPLLAINVAFGGFNLEQASGLGSESRPLLSTENILWYAARLPSETGWAAVSLALVFIGQRFLVRADRAASPLFVFLALWFVVGYVFFTGIQLKQPRFVIFLHVPVAIFAIAALHWGPFKRHAPTLAIAFSVFALAHTLVTSPVPRVTGYREAARLINERAQPGERIMFHGHRSASFIFSMREMEAPDARPITTLRAEKYLVNYRIGRTFGLESQPISKQEIEALIYRYAVRYVVFQSDFWTDVSSVKLFREVVESDHFKKLAEIPIDEISLPETPVKDAGERPKLLIYANNQAVSDSPAPVSINVPVINRTIGPGS